MELEGKNVSIDVDVLDEPLDYTFLLSHIWVYVMTTIASSIFHTLQFPHQCRIVTVDQLDYCTPNIHNHGANNVPFFKDSKLYYESVWVRLLKDSSLMGHFPITPSNTPQQVATIHVILSLEHQSFEFDDPWVVPSQF